MRDAIDLMSRTAYTQGQVAYANTPGRKVMTGAFGDRAVPVETGVNTRRLTDHYEDALVEMASKYFTKEQAA